MELLAVSGYPADMIALKYLLLTIGVVALVGAGAYAPMILGNGSSGSSTATTCTSTGTGTTTTTTHTSTSGTSTQGTISYSPPYPVKVDSVTASTYQAGNGTMVTFAVTYENIGSANIYTIAGCGSSLVATLPTGTDVIKRVTGGPVCLCAEAMTPVPPGGNRTSVTPGCWTAYRFLLVHPGTVEVNLTLYWGQSQTFQHQDMTNITGSFTFS